MAPHGFTDDEILHQLCRAEKQPAQELPDDVLLEAIDRLLQRQLNPFQRGTLRSWREQLKAGGKHAD